MKQHVCQHPLCVAHVNRSDSERYMCNDETKRRHLAIVARYRGTECPSVDYRRISPKVEDVKEYRDCCSMSSSDGRHTLGALTSQICHRMSSSLGLLKQVLREHEGLAVVYLTFVMNMQAIEWKWDFSQALFLMRSEVLWYHQSRRDSKNNSISRTTFFLVVGPVSARHE